MLEGLVAWVLNNYLGKYVENLNTDQLSIALLSGEVELENLPLKREALRHIGLPMEIKAGFIGKIRLQVPVRQIRTASWVIGIEQLYLVAGPINLDEYDNEAEEQAILEYKLSRLDALEARWRADIEHDPGYYASSYSSWLNYGTSLVTNIIENLQLNIKDVHIRYEDGITLPDDNGIAFGITIGALTTQSCDASWIPSSTSWNLTDASFKLMELDSLSVYWNHVKKDHLFGGLNLGDLAIAMSKNKIQRHILSPVNARAHIKRDRTERPLRSINKPRIVVDLLLDEVPLFITDLQYEEMVKCIKELDRIDRRKQQWRCRPVIPVKQACKEWWKYAARCHLGRDTLKPKLSWKDMLLRARENVCYVQTYTKLLGTSTPTSILSPEIKTLKEKIENERNFDELRVLRELAMEKMRPAKMQLPNMNVPQGRGMLEQWFPQWWGWSSKISHSNNGTQNGNSSTTFDGELLDVLADTMNDDTLLRRDTVFGQFNFALVQGAVSLCTAKDGSNRKTVIELKFERVNLSYESRPRSGSHKFSVSLGALYLHDFLTENSTFPILVQPQVTSNGISSRVRNSSEKLTKAPHHLFELIYEKRPLHVTVDHLLHVYSQSLDVVYNPTVIYWLIDFMCKPHRSVSSNQRFQAMKRRTRRQLIKNWEQILDGDFVYRSSWDLQFKISAPQILLVESFVDSNAAVVMVDFGKLHLSNANLNHVILKIESPKSDDDEDERYETPCSTPPGSQENGSLHDFQGLSETELHKKLYDQYSIDLVDLQILVGKTNDNWKHVRTRGTSSLHFLERFNISLQVERRVFTTSDPNFPSVTVSGNLPRLVVHVNEQKVGAIRLIYNLLSSFSRSAGIPQTEAVNIEPKSPRKEESRSLSHAVMVQFIIDQMAFELQSRGRSVAELQVSGVRAALSKRMADLSVSLSVHGLLLVDALQEFGPDFELLVASHKHVGMDSVSGRLRDSEPTSPVSPESPESPDSARPPRLTSPVALTNALSSLVNKTKTPLSPRNNSLVGLEKLDSEALIVVELTLVDDPTENLRMANIQFNNLDIIANQETIVELLGFFRRILPLQKSRPAYVASRDNSLSSQSTEIRSMSTRTEITFDFHRLNVLLLRAVMQDNHLVGQKIATATMSDARIQATLAANTSISGSLGGVQVLDQTSTGKTHQRIISVGRDPLADPQHYPFEHFSSLSDQPEAFRFVANRNTRQVSEDDCIEIDLDLTIRVASVWYTHAPHLISELRSCADEFKQYLSNFARQISAAATDMAIGLVNADDWTIPPRKRLPSVSVDLDNVNALSMKLDVLLESPVLVLPRSSHSRQVFVAHLGTMSLRHEPHLGSMAKHKVTLEVRDMNLYSLEMSANIGQSQSNLPRAEEMYSCKELGKPILHDTTLKILVEKQNTLTQSMSFLLDCGDFTSNSPIVQVHGAVITPLKVSLSRGQYEQLLDTTHRLFSMPTVTATAAVSEYDDLDGLSNYSEKLDLYVKVSFELPILSVQLKQAHSEQPLVELSMRDFVVKYDKLHRNESSVQVALRSLLMEDLLCAVGSRHRCMMQSSAPTRAKLSTGASKSCPDLAFARQYKNTFGRGSLPDRLETYTLYGAIPPHWRRKPAISSADTPNTPPPSPGGITSEENLVLMSITMTYPEENGCIAPEDRFYRKMVTVDFNCLDLVISVESWMVVFDFFGIAGLSGTADDEVAAHRATPDSDSTSTSKVDDNLPVRSETEIEVRSLTLVLTQLEHEIAKANVSNASMHILKTVDGKTKVSGSLGSMSLLDLTPHGRFYRERFLSSGRKALNFQYSSYADCEDRPHDARLKLEMSAVHYVHTQRFVAQLQAFFGHFSQLWSIMRNLRAGVGAVIDVNKRGTRLSLQLNAGAPVILLPVSSRSDELILLDLGELTAHNRFDTSLAVPDCLLDVMLLELVNMDVYAARRLQCDLSLNEDADALTVGGVLIRKMGSSLLTEKCHLKLRIERNLDTYISRDIPDLSVHGILSTMDCALDPEQYMLIRGLLSYNIGENLDDLRLLVQDWNHTVEYAIPTVDNRAKTWTRSCITLELVNVTVKLHPSHNIAALACINFIKSRLTLDSLSDGSQDIDLVSQEILIMDTRFQNEPVDRQCNVFTRILQPLRDTVNIEVDKDRVQAEVHHRKRKAYSATTILLHSMRLTAILDWWQAVRDFLLLNSPEPDPIPGAMQSIINQEAEIVDTIAVATPFELKINITDSELVIVEDTAILDTNAVILKTTAVLSYRSTPQEGEKPLSCNLSHCELFSCILGMENETALSIIDPVGASLDLTQDRCLEIQLQPLCVRLSYHDVTMFSRMLSSLPKQTLWAKQRSSEALVESGQTMDSQVLKLITLGFAEADCKIALDHCDGQLDDAALWLTQNAVPISAEAVATNNDSVFRTVELQVSCMRICIIDDCRDADVPLLELTLADFNLRKLSQQPGLLSATIGIDYYNRVLSGWEPFIEPWRANIDWEQIFISSLDPKRLNVSINSYDSVNVNITLTLVELVQLVKHNWTQDYYLSNGNTIVGKSSTRGQVYRRRSPFIPFALKNDTGCRLWFKTFIATADETIDVSKASSQAKNVLDKDDTWIEVIPGDTTPFTFEVRGKLRHHATHIVRRHQIAVLVEGWKPVDPVTVDRVGIYFRHANANIAGFQPITPKARLVFAVELEGSARKLVTIRSALQVSNKLAHPIEIKIEKSLSHLGYLPLTSTSTGRILQVPAQSVISMPLTHTGIQMCFKPLISNYLFQYCMESVDWTIVKKPLEVSENYVTCRTNQNNIFRMCVAVRRNNYPPDGIQVLPAHTITVMAPITLTNLLPYELTYEAGVEGGRITPGCSADLHCANLTENLEITIQLDGYPGYGLIILPPNSSSFTTRLKLLDSATRILYLQASVIVEKGAAVQINITAPYWIINKTGLPLVFRQEGVGIEAAGQFEEHERARMVAPLLFSFSDEEASRTLSVRIGTEVHPHGIPQWSQHFHLQPGIHVHRLRISLREGRPDIVYLISVATRAARGRYRATTVVTLSPRYQLHNKSSYTLELAQKCFTTTVSHPDAQATYITTMPDCHMPFHWPRLDKDLLLCVRITNVPDCMWSGGITLDDNYSLTINVRNATGKMHFLRVDVVLQETTFFIVFTDADTMPPPIRVDNFSEVSLLVNQIGVPDNFQWTVRPHSSVPYALDEPIETAGLVLTAPGGVTASYDLNILGEGRGLTYENFIYIAFTGTFKADCDLGTGESNLDPLDVETQRLVLEAGSGGWVALRRKQYGDRSQLWRMTGDGQLQHEGSSPPRDKHSKTPGTIFVLDIAGTAPQPFTYCALALRKPDSRRRSTQTWRFTDDGRLCCAHKNMCVQSKDGFMGLYEGGSVARWQMWSEAVLGPQTHSNPPPIEQRVGRQKLRPGSGFLSIRVTTDGPTRVLQVLDIKERKKTFALLEERDWSHIAVSHRPTQINADIKKMDSSELNLELNLPTGLGLSIVSQRPVEELLFARFAAISLDLMHTPLNTTLDLSVADVQIDNQLFEAQCTSVLFVTRSSRTEDESRPTLHLAVEKLQSKNQNAEIYKHVIVSVKPLCVHLEEKFILKLAAFLGIGKSELEVPVDENDFKAQRFISEVSAAHAKRYYFGALKLVPNQVKLSVLTTTKLPHHLQAVKRKLGLTLINFENATIELEPFVKKHPFESSQFLVHSIVKHYKDELKWQAAVILGSVDFLGNPLGFVSDVTEGVSGLIYEGSVKSLVKNVTHGISNSAAKVTESLSDGLGRVIMDERHEETRQRIRANTTGSSDHLVAGLKGFGFGLLGGVTSIFKQTYDGATSEGFPGFFAGFGRGVVGTITKPVVGVLDLATETASAVRETSRSAHRAIPKRDRPPRVVSGSTGLLPPYNRQQAEGQEFLYSINNHDYSELFVAYECLCSGSENLKLLVSNERVRVISGGTKAVVTQVNLAELLRCQPMQKVQSNNITLHYIELISRLDSSAAVNLDGLADGLLRRPKVRCDNEEVAKRVSQQINYAKGMHEERSLTLSSSDNMLDDVQHYNRLYD
ncbi:vacuolar protein sorting-associated protein 13D isoform X1 [Solenopsis invicta]|uniref:vacuolar protein sorting-associated protein 13D isoform X1 n=1 Tax=Solenopsis invicta TaxID=13686 RepID=UPI00193D1D2A|nr:vacuolar protein sorting-associated protein 13D isoform X1 [Solenopsis invicta]XP_039307515.1 vacuolar protein sorting-associated protein 13D isoform X1 [Solenopsis invicta]